MGVWELSSSSLWFRQTEGWDPRLFCSGEHLITWVLLLVFQTCSTWTLQVTTRRFFLWPPCSEAFETVDRVDSETLQALSHPSLFGSEDLGKSWGRAEELSPQLRVSPGKMDTGRGLSPLLQVNLSPLSRCSFLSLQIKIAKMLWWFNVLSKTVGGIKGSPSAAL